MRTYSLALFFVLFAFIQAQDCNNPLLSIYSIQGLPNPESGSELEYCTGLKAGQTCCSKDTVGTFQAELERLTEKLHNFAAARDLYLAQVKERYIDIFHDILDDLDVNNPDSLLNLQKLDEDLKKQYNSGLDLFFTISTELESINKDFYSSLVSYQQARASCFSTVLKIQTSMWCLACDPDYTNKGVHEDGTIGVSSNLCSTITQSCYPFLEQSVKFNPLLRARQSLERLRNLRDYLKSNDVDPLVDDTDDTDDNEDDTIDLNEDFISDLPIQKEEHKPILSQKTVTIPESCDANSCAWQCENLFAGSMLDELLVANGAGTIGGADLKAVSSATDVQIPLGTIENGVTGNLWDPDLEATGLQFSVLENPGDVYLSDDDDTDGDNDLKDSNDGDENDNDDNDGDNDGNDVV